MERPLRLASHDLVGTLDGGEHRQAVVELECALHATYLRHVSRHVSRRVSRHVHSSEWHELASQRQASHLLCKGAIRGSRRGREVAPPRAGRAALRRVRTLALLAREASHAGRVAQHTRMVHLPGREGRSTRVFGSRLPGPSAPATWR